MAQLKRNFGVYTVVYPMSNFFLGGTLAAHQWRI
jgi:hypothetical protein